MRTKADSLLEEIGKGTKGLRLLLADAKETLIALDVELEDASTMLEDPVVFRLPEPCAAE